MIIRAFQLQNDRKKKKKRESRLSEVERGGKASTSGSLLLLPPPPRVGFLFFFFLVLFVFFLLLASCLFLGELVGPWGSHLGGNTDINLPQQAGGTDMHRRVGRSAISSELRDAVLEMQRPPHRCLINAWETAGNLCSHFIKHVTISPGPQSGINTPPPLPPPTPRRADVYTLAIGRPCSSTADGEQSRSARSRKCRQTYFCP